MKTTTIPGFERIALIVSDLTLEDLTTWLTPDERELASGFSRERRRDEWAASRIAARVLALNRGFVTRANELTFGRDEEKPWAVTPDRRRLFVSFSHTLSRGAASLDESPVGIDIERIRPVDRRAWKFFLSEDEIREVDSTGVEQAALHWWCAKEAAFKLVNASSLKAVRLQRELEADQEARFSGAGFTVTSTVMGEIVAAVARGSSRQDDGSSSS